METTIYWDNGKSNRNCYNRFPLIINDVPPLNNEYSGGSEIIYY